MILAILLCTLGLCLLIGIPIFMSLGIATLASLLYSDIPLVILAQTLYQGIDQFPLLAVPCFILAGSLMEYGGVTKQIIDVVSNFTGRTSGGLGVATVLACMFFSSISGSGPGTVAAVGSMMIPAMIRQGYSKEYAGAVAASGGSLGILIPPSNPMIIYGVVAECSIVGLFMAGFIPGLIIGTAQCFVAYYLARRLAYEPTGEPFVFKKFLSACWKGKFSLATPFVILGGIYGGVFTPVEASVVAVMYGLFVGLVINRALNFQRIFEAITNSARISCTIIIVATSTVFGQILVMNQAPAKLAKFLTTISTDWFVIMLIIIGVFYVLGMFMETLSTIIIVTPILLPVVKMLGIDPIHFGIIFVVTNEVAFLTPPLGVNLFVSCQLANVTLEKLSLAVIPYILAITACIIVLTYFPKISLWLPRLLGYGF